MKNLRRLAAFGTALLLLMSVAACEGGAKADTEAADTGILNIQIETEVQTLDAQLSADDTSAEVIACFMDGLYQMDEDGNPTLALAAEEPTVSEDKTHYTFRLREDAFWSNGEPVTADDFVFAWRRAVDPDTASEYAFMVADVAQIKNGAAIAAGEMDVSELGVSAADAYTLEVELEAPVSFFASLLYFPTFYPVNEAFYESCDGTYGTSPDTVLSNGAFVVSEYEPAAASFRLTKNESYYDTDRISLQGLRYFVVKDSQQALLSYQCDALDVIAVSGEQVEQVKEDPEYSSINAGYLWYISPNISAGIGLENENLRKAISAAFDRTACAGRVIKDGSQAASWAVLSDYAYDENGVDFRDTARVYEGTNQEAAREYFALAREELGQEEFCFTLIYDDDDTAVNVAAFLKEQIETTLPGVTIELKVESKKQRMADMQEGSYELGLARWGPDFPDPTTYLQLWRSDNSNNFGLWRNDEYDALLDACTGGELAADPAARWEVLHRAEELVMEEAVIFPVYEKYSAVMVQSNVSGIAFHTVGLNRVFKDVVKR